ncbi:MAG: hypothetical protein M1828_005602 [Chrysothrix sp. TS-e1954]|nr:MAG: hypothetical protein M1828_005602 [Chrysothrix sp. TS-e1954]
MVLEATMIIVDNSEHSRNGDYLPTRFDAQSDCANLIFSAKTNSNPESSVGLMSLGGSQPEVLTTLTTDQGRISDGLHRIKIRGVAHLATALNVAGLALKHRQNKSQHSRVVVFVCSPVEESESGIVKLARRMKKNNVAVDVVCFGDVEGETVRKMEAFHSAIKSGDEAGDDASHLAVIPPGPNLLSDSIVASNILAGAGMGPGAGGQGAGGAGAGAGGGGGMDESGGGEANGFEFGIDPSADPELALALRMSMEEEERRQREQRERERGAEGEKLESVPEGGEGAEGEKKDGEGSSGAAAPAADGESGGSGGGAADKKDGDTGGSSGPAGDDKMDTS